MELDRVSQGRLLRGRRYWIVTLLVFLIILILIVVATANNRGFALEIGKYQLKATLEPAAQPTSSSSSQSEHSMAEMSTTGAASPIVTGQGAVVTSTVVNTP